MTKICKVVVQEEGDDLVIEFPEEVIVDQGWEIGDTLEWIINDDYVILRKSSNESSSTE